MRCPFCDHPENRVVDSRKARDGSAIRRRRECDGCDRRFTTYERVEEIFPQIIKSDGSREDYDRVKALRGIRLACSKRPISTAELDEVLDRVERRMLDLGEREVESDWLGGAITSELRKIDPIAYIRFASVYRGFSDIEQFVQELRKLDSETSGDNGGED